MGKKTLIIVRHGNTFSPEQTPTRVGRGTDLPLVEDKRGRSAGKYLLSEGYSLDKAYAAPLKRTMQTANLILEEMHSPLTVIPEIEFSEIDYGPDENKTEEEVQLRLGQNYILENNIPESDKETILNFGKQIITQWDKTGAIPNGWSVNIDSIINTWHNFANSIKEGETTLICSSNGIIRFAPHILEIPYHEFCEKYDIKVATGSVSIFECEDGKWTCKEWNSKPYKLY